MTARDRVPGQYRQQSVDDDKVIYSRFSGIMTLTFFFFLNHSRLNSEWIPGVLAIIHMHKIWPLYYDNKYSTYECSNHWLSEFQLEYSYCFFPPPYGEINDWIKQYLFDHFSAPLWYVINNSRWQEAWQINANSRRSCLETTQKKELDHAYLIVKLDLDRT